MASSLVVINQTPQSTSTNSGNENDSASILNRQSTGQHAKLKILNDVMVSASVADSIQLAAANSTLISPCALNKSSQMSPLLILSDNIDLNKTFSLATGEPGSAISNGQLENNTELSHSQAVLLDSNVENTELNNNTNSIDTAKHTKFKIRYHYNSYSSSSNYQSYQHQSGCHAERTQPATSNLSDSSSSASSPIMSSDSNLASPIILPDLAVFPNLDPLSVKLDQEHHQQQVIESNLSQPQHAFKFSSILVSSSSSSTSTPSKQLKEDSKSQIETDQDDSNPLKPKMTANLKMQLNINNKNENNENNSDTKTSNRSNTTSSSTSETLRRHVNHHYHQIQKDPSVSINDQQTQPNVNLEINGKIMADQNEAENKTPISSPRCSAKREESSTAVKKEKKKVSFNDSLLQVHLIPNISYNSLSIEKFKYQLKTTTITMENNDIDEENDLIGYDDYPVLTHNTSTASSSNQYANYRLSRQTDSATPTYASSYYDHTPIRERDSPKQININFYNSNTNNTNNTNNANNETSASKTSFLLSSSLISSFHNSSTVNNNESIGNSSSVGHSNSYQYTTAPQVHELSKAFMPNSKLYRTTIFKTFQETNDSKPSDQARRNTSANRESSALRNNSAKSDNSTKSHDNQTDMNNNNTNRSASDQQINSVGYLNKYATKKRESPTATSITGRVGSSNTSASNNSIYQQNQRSYSSILASTFSSQPHLIANYSFSNQLQLKQQQQQQHPAQIQLQSANLSIPFHSSVLNDDTYTKTYDLGSGVSVKQQQQPASASKRQSPAHQFENGVKNENAILRVNSGAKPNITTPKSTKPMIAEANKSDSTLSSTEVHQSLAMSFELTPELKFLSNLKTPKQTTSLYINNTELKDMIHDDSSHLKPSTAITAAAANNSSQQSKPPDEVQVQLQHNSSNRKSTASDKSHDNLSAPIIANLSAGLFKQKFSTKAGSTKYIFLKSDDKQTDLNITPSTFSSNHYNSLNNKSYTNSKINFNSQNTVSINSAASVSNPTNTSSANTASSLNQLADMVRLSPDIKNTAYHSNNAKNLAMSTVNQLFALKDVNYYVTNSSRALRKYNQNLHKNLSKPSSSNGGEVTTIKLHSFSQNLNPSDSRQTKSALPMLRSSKISSVGGSTGTDGAKSNGNNANAVASTSTNVVTTPSGVNENKNFNNCFNNLSYRLINTPTLIGNLNKAKTFLYNQNQNANNGVHSFEKRVKENLNDKTTL